MRGIESGLADLVGPRLGHARAGIAASKLHLPTMTSRRRFVRLPVRRAPPDLQRSVSEAQSGRFPRCRSPASNALARFRPDWARLRAWPEAVRAAATSQELLPEASSHRASLVGTHAGPPGGRGMDARDSRA